MKTTSFRARTLACALLTTTATCGLTAAPALAQSNPQPAYRALDENSVDLTHGDFVLSFLEGRIGSGDGELALVRQRLGNDPSSWDGMRLIETFSPSGAHIVTVSFGTRWEQFVNGVAKQANGATIADSGNGFVYRAADGTTINFDTIASGTTSCEPTSSSSCSWVPSSISSPDLQTVQLTWDSWIVCSTTTLDDCSVDGARLSQVRNSFGYAIQFQYAQTSGGGGSTGAPPAWFRRTGATFHNEVTGGAASASVSYSYPSAEITEVTDMAGRTWRFTRTSNNGVAVRRPGAASDSLVYTTDAAGKVTSVLNEGVTTNYSRSVSESTVTTTVTDALNQQTVVTSDLNVGRPTSIRDPLNRTTSFQYDPNGRLTRTTAPEGNLVQYTLDARGNVTETRAVAKAGSGQPDIVAAAAYPADCSNPATCNQPVSTTDARGNVTDYQYDSTHGGLLSVTFPIAYSDARPKTQYVYSLVNGEYRLTGTSACQMQRSCAGTSDEVKTSFTYDANGNVTSISSGAGDRSLLVRESMTYDAMGDLVSHDGPLDFSADTARYRYNGGRELVGIISPDPDGSGPLKHRAVRNVINGSGLLARRERGNVNSQSDADWGAMPVAEAIEIDYDQNARPVAMKLTGGGTTYELTQTSYDPVGRVECAAVRMNPEAFRSLPTSACSLGAEGAFGPDRIAKSIYDAAGQVTQLRSGVGTPGEAAEATTTYTGNGQVASVTDAENNHTTYQYDGYDRLARTFFPSPTKGAGTSNPNDYEEQGYDPNGNVTSFRNRAGQTTLFTFSARNRLIRKDLPDDRYSTYTYDLLGRLFYANQGATVSFTYDALGRKLTESDDYRTIKSEYDSAGRRTMITHPDGYPVAQQYLVTGEVSGINGGGRRLTFGYDDLGRRTSLTRGNGTSTGYSYDGASRLSQLSHDLGGTTHDLTLGFSYNPAGQIVSRTSSNDAYAFTAHTSGTVSETPNGLNQLVQQGGSAITYDARGNVTYDPATGFKFSYSSENLLKSVDGGAWRGYLIYDPLMRLLMAGSNSYTRSFYDGEDRVAEFYGDERSLLVVHGPGIDEPLITYDDVNGARYLYADERGSIIAGASDAGTVDKVYAYDEFGMISAPRRNRFEFTGHVYESVSGLLYARNRFYNPALGRFMQPDPIGYGDGMNMYARTNGDPVNFVDPYGLESCAEKKAKAEAIGEILSCGVKGGGSGGGGSGGGGLGGSGGFSGGGGVGYGGGGATGGGWGDPSPTTQPGEPVQQEIVVTGRRPNVTRAATARPSQRQQNRIFFGYPPEPNSAWHITRHLTELTPRERRLVRRQVGREVLKLYPNLRFQQYATGFVTFRGREFQWRAFGARSGITNIGTIIDATE